MDNITLRTHAMSQHAKSPTQITILGLQDFLLNRLVVDSLYMGRAEQS
jgi:hypothetical protein